MITHRGAYLTALGQIVEAGLRPESRYLWTLPIFHCNGWCYAWAVTAIGGTHICLRKFDPNKVWSLIENEGITHMSGSPNMYAALLNTPGRPRVLKAPVTFGMGGGPASPGLIAQCIELGARIIHGYGLTETYGPYTLCEWQPEWQKLSLREQAKLMARQGVPSVLGDAARVVDEHMRDIRQDGQSIGEVVMRGAHVMKGYYKEPEATARDFRGGWFHSGDLAVVHPDGYIELRDRLLDVIVVGGEKVSSNEVEQALCRHPAICAACTGPTQGSRLVTQHTDGNGKVTYFTYDALDRLVKQIRKQTDTTFAIDADDAVTTSTYDPAGRLVLTRDARIKGRQLISFCRQHLAAFKCPTDIEFISSLPRTTTGKVQKFILREREWVGQEKRIHGV